MPKQKDLKRIVRSRMQKTGESYTAARTHVVQPKPVQSKPAQPEPVPPAPDYGALAGKSDEAVQKVTGRTWAEWVAVLDAFDGTKKAHRDLALHVSSLGTPDWWSQSVVVGYERIRGLRAIGQRLEGSWEASKSRTFPVPVATLFAAFADAKKRSKWLAGVKLTVRTATKDRSMRIAIDDGSLVLVNFTAKGDGKSAVAVAHTKLASKADADRAKVFWTEQLEKLSAAISIGR